MENIISIPRGRLVGVLLANAILWGAAILVTGDVKLGGTATIALIVIGTLLRGPQKA